MKCQFCEFESNVKDFKLINQNEIINSLDNLWEIHSTYKKKERICPICKKTFPVGTPLLYKIVKIAHRPMYLTKNIATDAKILLKKKKKYFTLPEIQEILKIAIPIEAENKMRIMALSNLFKIITYHNVNLIKKKKKYEFSEKAEELIYQTLEETPPDDAYEIKIEDIDHLLETLNNSYNKPQSNLILNILNNQKNEKVLNDALNNVQVKPSKFYAKYETIIKILIYLLDIIENEKILTTKELMSEIGLETKDLRKVKQSLNGILKCKLLYFNILASNIQIYLEPIPIPREITEEIARLEIILRTKLITSLKNHYGNYKDAFLNGIPSQLNYPNIGTFSKDKFIKNLTKQLKNNARIDKSNKSRLYLDFYLNSGICSLELYEQFMQQLDFNHLIILIYYHWQTIFKVEFTSQSLNNVIIDLRLIKDARNTDSHRKYKLIELASLIESMFRIKKIIEN